MPIIKDMDMEPAGRWRRAQEVEKTLGEDFLIEHEKKCVAACSRYRSVDFTKDHIWFFSDENRPSAMIIHNRNTLFPVYGGSPRAPFGAHMCRLLGTMNIHAVQGLETDVRTAISRFPGTAPADFTEYFLMSLDLEDPVLRPGPPPDGVILRRASLSDMENLIPLQSAYEREEVLPAGAPFNPQHSRLNLEKIIKYELNLVAVFEGKIVGKINTNAEGFTRRQIGGVYVLPEYRGRGIAGYMTSAFSGIIHAGFKGITLFVRKKNDRAVRVYRSAGFSVTDNYAIAYF